MSPPLSCSPYCCTGWSLVPVRWRSDPQKGHHGCHLSWPAAALPARALPELWPRAGEGPAHAAGAQRAKSLLGHGEELEINLTALTVIFLTFNLGLPPQESLGPCLWFWSFYGPVQAVSCFRRKTETCFWNATALFENRSLWFRRPLSITDGFLDPIQHA